MLKHVSIQDLVPGMYVNQVVDQTGNLQMRSKGIIKSKTIIDTLKTKGILMVEVDFDKSTVPPQPLKEETPESAVSATQKKTDQSESLNEANDLYMKAVLIQGEFIDSLNRGAANDLSSASDLSQSIIDSVFDNPDALSCLTMIKNTDEYLLEHSINCTILMAIFCEYLGYDRDIIDEACMGALLMDIGMASVPEDLYHQRNDLSEADWAVVQGHVESGVNMVEQYEEITDTTLEVIQQHHERVDGSGYPKGLVDDEISPFSQIAAIVDSYDAMISNRPHRESLPPSVALKRLIKDSGLNQALVKQFVTCIGIHPVGSLVKLKSGKLGIVSTKNPKDMLNPTVMTFYSINANHYNEIKRIDLSKVDDEIVSGIRPEEFSIDLPRFFKDVFLHQMPKG